MNVTIDGNELVIRIAMQEPKPSASGKTLVLATTHGNVKSGLKVGDKEVVVGLNAYIPAG